MLWPRVSARADAGLRLGWAAEDSGRYSRVVRQQSRRN
jgi:hypothetical protein